MSNKRKLKVDNKGYSLVELIVALLVTSVVMLAVVSFITTSISSYQSTNSEATLQMESQVAANAISDILIEAINMDFTSSTIDSSDCQILSIENVDGYFLVVLDELDSKLRLKKLNGPEIILRPDGKLDTYAATVSSNIVGNDRYLLANYATDLRIQEISEKLVGLELDFEFGGKNYVGNYMINKRNVK